MKHIMDRGIWHNEWWVHRIPIYILRRIYKIDKWIEKKHEQAIEKLSLKILAWYWQELPNTPIRNEEELDVIKIIVNRIIFFII